MGNGKMKTNRAAAKRFKLTGRGKVKRNKHGLSARTTWKKAYVRLQQGQDIDFTTVE